MIVGEMSPIEMANIEEQGRLASAWEAVSMRTKAGIAIGAAAVAPLAGAFTDGPSAKASIPVLAETTQSDSAATLNSQASALSIEQSPTSTSFPTFTVDKVTRWRCHADGTSAGFKFIFTVTHTKPRWLWSYGSLVINNHYTKYSAGATYIDATPQNITEIYKNVTPHHRHRHVPAGHPAPAVGFTDQNGNFISSVWKRKLPSC